MAHDQPYSDITVLDMSFGLGSYAARLFADLGADVTRLEPPGGASDRRLMNALPEGPARDAARYTFAFRNTSKSSECVDVDTPDGLARVQTLVGDAHVLFLERDGLLADRVAWLREINPAAVLVVMSPFGSNGPHAHWKANDLTLQAAGGIAWLSGRGDGPPLRLPVDQSVMIASAYASAAAAAALFDAERTGHGHLIEISAQECIAHSLQNALQVYDLEGVVSSRGGDGARDAAEMLLPCLDGRVAVASPLGLGPSWYSLVAWIREEGHAAADILEQPRWSDAKWRRTQAARDEFREEFGSFIAGHTREDIMTQALKRKIVMSPVSKIGDVLRDKQLAYRNYFTSLPGIVPGREVLVPGAPYQFSEAVWAVTPPPLALD